MDQSNQHRDSHSETRVYQTTAASSSAESAEHTMRQSLYQKQQHGDADLHRGDDLDNEIGSQHGGSLQERTYFSCTSIHSNNATILHANNWHCVFLALPC